VLGVELWSISASSRLVVPLGIDSRAIPVPLGLFGANVIANRQTTLAPLAS
jgi:hypothetical protein